ncbi:hypothetical protein [Wukongibacter sp. M2B1]|uniref:hypothetical protein n=1 Tax=Wukongibacter sp. M2B1 TaxID=3088895 RepID=UPI003D78DC4B
MSDKQELKNKIHNEIDKIIDKIELVGSLKYFEVSVKCTNEVGGGQALLIYLKKRNHNSKIKKRRE